VGDNDKGWTEAELSERILRAITPAMKQDQSQEKTDAVFGIAGIDHWSDPPRALRQLTPVPLRSVGLMPLVTSLRLATFSVFIVLSLAWFLAMSVTVA